MDSASLKLLADKILSGVIVRESGCWYHNGSQNDYGYGTISFEYKNYLSHRVLASKHFGVPLDGTHVVAHKCDTTWCVNPEHLFITDRPGNSTDMKIKGRGKNQYLPWGATTHCLHGHEKTAANTFINSQGKRCCRECALVSKRKYNAMYIDRRYNVRWNKLKVGS